MDLEQLLDSLEAEDAEDAQTAPQPVKPKPPITEVHEAVDDLIDWFKDDYPEEMQQLDAFRQQWGR